MSRRDPHYQSLAHILGAIYLCGQNIAIPSVSSAVYSLKLPRIHHFTHKLVREDGPHLKVSDVRHSFYVIIVQFHFAKVLALIFFIVLTILNLEDTESKIGLFPSSFSTFYHTFQIFLLRPSIVPDAV